MVNTLLCVNRWKYHDAPMSIMSSYIHWGESFNFQVINTTGTTVVVKGCFANSMLQYLFMKGHRHNFQGKWKLNVIPWYTLFLCQKMSHSLSAHFLVLCCCWCGRSSFILEWFGFFFVSEQKLCIITWFSDFLFARWDFYNRLASWSVFGTC